IRYACSTQLTYSAGVSSPIMSVRLRINVLRLRQLSMTNLPFNDPGNASLRGPVDVTKAQRDFAMAKDIFISCARPSTASPFMAVLNQASRFAAALLQ